jgi:hypothetical protein
MRPQKNKINQNNKKHKHHNETQKSKTKNQIQTMGSILSTKKLTTANKENKTSTVFLFDSSGFLTQGFMLYHSSQNPSPFCFSCLFFSDGVLCFCPG